MSKNPIPLHVDDLSGFTRALSKQLAGQSPSHLLLMNMVARAAGFQNVQHMRAISAARTRMQNRPLEESVDARLVERVLNQFDAQGHLRQWPSRRNVQTMALWALWARFPAQREMPEKAVNAALAQEHLFNDPATLRRTMISCGLMTRLRDGSNYCRVEQEPPPDAKAIIHALSARRKMRSPIGAS